MQNPTEISTRRKKPLIPLLLAVVAGGLAALGVAWAKLDAGSEAAEPRVTLLSVPVETTRHQDFYEARRLFVGRVEPTRSGDLGFELAGRLEAVTVDEGDRAATGEVLAKLDVERLMARRAELDAELARTRAELSLAKATLRRIDDLVKAKHASAQELDEAREAHRALLAAVELAQSRIRSVEVDLDKSRLKAPYAAVVTRRLADEGYVVAAGQAVLGLQEIAPRDARVGIAGRALESVKAGDSHTVRVNGGEVPATVKAVLPFRRSATRTVDVLLTLNTEPEKLREGDLVELQLPYRVPEAGFWVPLTALTEAQRGLWATYVAEPMREKAGLGPTHRLRQRLVEVVDQGTERAFVRGTLSEGDLLVTDGLHRIVPGQLVKVDARRDQS